MGRLELGPFVLHARIARGGMGEVWRARHADGTDAAIKVLPTTASGPASIEAFRRELRAVARLDHPHIVYVLDAGTVPPDTGEGLVAGSPWVAMELLGGGTWRTVAPHQDFAAVRRTLLEVLDALAHAHARGVLHRDVKPSNVLFTEEGSARLSDFGIMYPRRRGPQEAGAPSAGTPGYAPPEQIAGRWSLLGPETDLYALGCTAYTVVCQRRPYPGRGPALLQAHLEAPLPDLAPVVPVPDGLAAWVRRLMAKHPRDRFVSAAEAAAALHALKPVSGGRAPARRRSEPHLTTLVLPAERVPSTPSSFTEDHTVVSVPVPSSWRTAALHEHRIEAAGLGLYGLRTTPCVGRHDERDQLWAALARVRDSRRPGVVVLRGPSGFGKTRLARWLCERAEELGIGRAFEALHSERPAAFDGLRGLLARALNAWPEHMSDPVGHVREALGLPDEAPWADRVAAVVAPGSGVLGGEDALHAAVLRAILRQSRGLMPVILLDDAQWAPEALRFAEAVIAQREPALVVLTVREEALPDRPAAARAIEELGREDGASVWIGPLSDAQQRDLLRALLSLDPRTTELLRSRTSGNPLFAVQLVDDWVHRGVLRPGPQGWAPRPDASLAIPSSLAEVWQRRVERALEAHEDWWIPLLIGAALGERVDSFEWSAACDAAGVRAPEALVAHLESRRLLSVGELGWSFVHGMLRESIAAQTDVAGHTARVHRACAKGLAPGGASAADRRSRHLERAGDLPEAAAQAHLHTQFVSRRMAGPANAAFATAADRELDLAYRAVTPPHPLLVDAELDAAFKLILDPGAGMVHLVKAETMAAALPEPAEPMARVCLIGAQVCRARLALDEALPWIERGIQVAPGPRYRQWMFHELAQIVDQMGHAERALEARERAAEGSQNAELLGLLAESLAEHGRTEEAASCLLRARAAVGSRALALRLARVDAWFPLFLEADAGETLERLLAVRALAEKLDADRMWDDTRLAYAALIRDDLEGCAAHRAAAAPSAERQPLLAQYLGWVDVLGAVRCGGPDGEGRLGAQPVLPGHKPVVICAAVVAERVRGEDAEAAARLDARIDELPATRVRFARAIAARLVREAPRLER